MTFVLDIFELLLFCSDDLVVEQITEISEMLSN